MLQAAGICKSFQGAPALDHVTLALRAGEVHALVGGNGAGKSTLVKVLSGVCRPDAGRLRFLGEEITFSSPPRRPGSGSPRSTRTPGSSPR